MSQLEQRPNAIGQSAAPAQVLLVGPSAVRSSASYCLLALLRWANREVSTPPRAVVLASGPLQEQFRHAGARVLGEPFSAVHQVERVVGRLASLRAAGRIRRERQRAALLRPPRPSCVYASTVHAAGPVVRFLGGKVPIVVHAYETAAVLDELVASETMAKLVAATSRWVAASTQIEAALVERGVPAERIVRCAPFIDEPVSEPGAVARARASLGLRPGEVVVGGVGRSTWEDAPEVFLRVASVVRRRAPELAVRFVWVGAPADGPSRWILDHDVRRGGLGDVVTFVDGVDDVAPWLSVFDLLCLTSRLDPPPPAVIEAGALATPALAFQQGDLAELATEVADHRALRPITYLDVDAMAQAVIEAAGDREGRVIGGQRFRDIVQAGRLSTTAAPPLWNVLADAAGHREQWSGDTVGGDPSPRR
ncbi:MAG: glycosyltransferase [Acidimicrobiia bacterium]|nr:glycosyltransferase [Acidimicrobiia bacterium]